MPLADAHLINPDVDQLRQVQCGVGSPDMVKEHPPKAGVAFSKNLARPTDRHLSHERECERLKVLGEVLALALSGHRYRPDLPALTALRPGRGTQDLRRLAEGIQMPP